MPAFSISEITPYLYISSFPVGAQVEQVQGLGIRLILSMYLLKPHRVFNQPPMTLLWTPVIDSPLTPIPISVFRRGVRAALPVIEDGGKVLVHCRWGVHRSVAMACCILIAKGFSLDDAVALVKRQRTAARPEDVHILDRIRKFDEDWLRRMQEKAADG